MSLFKSIVMMFSSFLLLGSLGARAEESAPAEAAVGQIIGQTLHQDGDTLGGIAVAIAEIAGKQQTTDSDGRFRFDDLLPGDYTLHFRLGNDHAEAKVQVDGQRSQRVWEFNWLHGFSETLTVRSATRKVERIVDAPVAVNVVSRDQIELGSALSQIPKLFESASGVETTQSGLFDFKLNVRGVNSSLNRRLAVTIDGRDPSFPLLDAQEWVGASFPVDDLETAELIRGPSSALYGVNAFNGFLNLVTKAPHSSLGKSLRLALGERNTSRLDARFAVPLSGDWFFKGLGSYTESDDFFESRNENLDYSEPCGPTVLTDCLTFEAVPVALDRDRVGYLGLRADRIRDTSSLVIEGGQGHFEGPIFTGPAGRVQLIDGTRPWARINYNRLRWNVLVSYTGRDVDGLTLAPGSPSFSDSSRLAFDLQTHHGFASGKGRMVIGASASHEEVSTADSSGFETLLFEAQTEDTGALFGQIDYELSKRAKVVAAGRWDTSSRHDEQFSPQLGLVVAPSSMSSIRLSYREAFLSPSYPEFSVRVPIAPPLDLSSLESVCQLSGTPCGFDSPLPLLLVGNPNLEVETIETLELGYSRFFGSRSYFNMEVYRSEVDNFVQVAVPQLGTALGRINTDFGAYVPPGSLDSATRDLLLGSLEEGLGFLFPFLSNELGGHPALVLLTNANFGRATTQGAELSFDVSLTKTLHLDVNYSWIDFEAREELPGLSPLVANSPEHKGNLSLRYNGPKLGASLHYRWVDGFRWIDGIYQGTVPSYDVLNISANYQLSDRWRLGVDVSNLFDNVHYEFFGGDLLRRHALAHLSLSW